ncbi:hypothetical protein L838_5053 [Mycobacterium avium MAV_120709_2344]|nr:hypothetical protein L838_5053 [Mycobacterium avium MAV_120709_2344]
MQLLVTGRHVANRCLPGFFPRRRSRVPGNDRTGSRIPVMHRPECDHKTSSELRRNYRKAAAIGRQIQADKSPVDGYFTDVY